MGDPGELESGLGMREGGKQRALNEDAGRLCSPLSQPSLSSPCTPPWAMGLNVTQSQSSSSEKPVQPGEQQGQGVGVAGGASCWSDQKKLFPSHKDRTEPRVFSGTARGPLGPPPAEPAHPCVWL